MDMTPVTFGYPPTKEKSMSLWECAGDNIGALSCQKYKMSRTDSISNRIGTGYKRYVKPTPCKEITTTMIA